VLRRGVSRGRTFSDQLGRIAPPPRPRCALLWICPTLAAEARQVPPRLRSLAELLEGQLLSPPCFHAWWSELPILRRAGREPSHWTLCGPQTSAGAAHPALPPPGFPQRVDATALTRHQTRHFDFRSHCFCGHRSGIVVAAPTPLGGLAPAQHAWPISQSEPCRRVTPCWPRPSTDCSPNLPTDQAVEPGGLPHGTVPLIAALAGPGLDGAGPSAQSSVASFGLGCQPVPLGHCGWAQVPLGCRCVPAFSIGRCRHGQSAGASASSCPTAAWSWSWSWRRPAPLGPLPLLLQ